MLNNFVFLTFVCLLLGAFVAFMRILVTIDTSNREHKILITYNALVAADEEEQEDDDNIDELLDDYLNKKEHRESDPTKHRYSQDHLST